MTDHTPTALERQLYEALETTLYTDGVEALLLGDGLSVFAGDAWRAIDAARAAGLDKDNPDE